MNSESDMPQMEPDSSRDEAAQLRDLITECLTQLRQGQVPQADASRLPPASQAVALEFLHVSGQIKTKNLSLMHGLETLRDGFAIFGKDQRLIFANNSFRTFFRQKVRIDTGVHLQLLCDAIDRHQMTDMSGTQMMEWVMRAVTDDAEPLIVRLSSGEMFRWSMRRDPSGNLVLIASDISRERARQFELEQLMAEASRASDAKTTFLAHMSHELRTPMNGVIGMAEMLCDSGLDPERQRYAETIRNSAEALLTIINDVLDFSRGRSDGIRLTEASFDLEKVVVEVATLLQPSARAKGLDLRVLCDPMMPTRWHGDEGRVRQVVVNLLGNAVKYTQTGFVRLIVTPGSEGPNVLIYDSGPGIPDERVDSIFEEFSQLAEPGLTGISGSGLGLAITAQLVQAMGGNLWLDSHPGTGSTFGVNLPLRSASNTQQPLPPVAPQAGTILAVQDDRVLSRHLRRMTAGTGLRMDIRNDDEGLRDALDSGPPPALALLFCTGDRDRIMRRVDLLRRRSPGTKIWLMVSASQQHPASQEFDRVVTLPVIREALLAPMIAQVSASTPADAAPPPTELRQMKVLVADDNATNRLVIEKMLRHCDCILLPAEDGQQAVTIWQQEQPDLILMDVSMPVMDGKQAAQAIRRIEQAKGLPPTRIVAVTAAVSDEDRAEVLASGIDEVLTKPVRRAGLTEQLTRHAPADARPPLPPDEGQAA
ncbi:MAG: ATP-binding protein [Paracoccus sp. (in: a-proteobacteria)]|uniref:ATP-binding protein n=1 Tax=Paracoccus sp. TaxID=267 RepID=UPI0026E0C393|nr:ATP-binding protein [Paracoccus sp. (in: a-proteobacteria)]MDO5612436.1 ATP-binding protein [Paracoccus sp. (in: a-proteobacteria)]